MWNSTDDKKKKKKQQKTSYSNPFEALEDIGKGIGTQLADQSKAGVGEAAKQLFGGEFNLMAKPAPKGGDLAPGQEVDLKAQAKAQQEQKQAQKKAENIRPALDYVGEILHGHEKQSAQEAQKTREDIQNLIAEVKSLGNSGAVEQQVIEATGGNVVSPGKYHVNFFKWAIAMLTDARKKSDNSNVWLSASKGKGKGGQGKQKKGMNYWDMAKKHGNDFTMSGERSTATSTG